MFDKKYIAGIASFSGIAVNNVKALTGELTIKIDNIEYKLSTGIDSKITAVDKLLEALNGANLSGTNPLILDDNVKEKYFLKSLASVNPADATVVNIDENLKITLADDKQVKIELVSKTKCIEFEYTGKKQLKKDDEYVLLKTIIQGNKLDTVITGTDILSSKETSTLNELALNDNSKIIGKDVKVLDENNKIKFKIDSEKIAVDHFKTVVCKFNNDVKLVDGINLEALYNLDLKDIKKGNLDSATLISELKKAEASCDDISAVFLNDNFDFTVINGNSNITIKKNEDNKKFDDVDFIVLDDIKAADINSTMFFKKNFTVVFDNEGDNTKKVDDKILDKIKDALNTKFRDRVKIKVSEITSEITKVKNDKDKDITVADAFRDLNNISIDGVNKAKDDKLKDTDDVIAPEIKINLKSAAFAAGIVKTVFKFDVDFDAVKKDSKGLNSAIVKIINKLKGTIKGFEGELEIECFLNDVNKAFKDYFLQGQNLADTDFDFSACKQNENGTSLNKSGTIKAKDTIVSKLKPECFETPKNPEEHKDNQSNSTSTGTGSGDKKPKKRCCNSNK